MNATQQASRVYALLADGTTVEIRPATPADFDAVLAMYEAMSPDNTYLRFFNLSRRAAEAEAQRTCRDPSPGHVSLLALSGDVVVGCAGYYTFGATAAPADQVTPGAPVAPGAPVTPVAAEIAFAVGEHMHHRGIATLLLEHLVSVAASHQVQAFTAETRAENTAMLKVFADAGLPVHRRYARGVVELTFPIPRTDDGPALDTYLNAVAGRERLADAASLRHLFAPESVVVIGASRRPGTVGRAILDNVRTGGYLGRLYAVNPHAEPIGGIPCWPAVADLPEAPDLAVIAVPAASVLDTVEQCGRRGVQSVVVITSGLDADGCAGLLAACRQHGMRLVGPNCFGVAVPGIGLDATFAASHPRPGSVGLVTQSGGLGFAMVDQLSRLGIGISSFASVGNKLDVSSNDLLLWWEQDGLTKLAVLYIESFGNPRKFARTARRVGATMPVLTVHAGRSAAGQRAAASHTAAVASPLVSREALFAQAGIIATPGLGELTEVTALLATQPVPAGGTVAIVSNVGGAGVLTADACADLGLAVHHPAGQTSRKLRALLPGGTVSGPVDTTAAVSGADFRQCLELLAADEDVDAMIVLVLPTAATGDLIAAIAEADLDVPVAAVVLNQPETVRLITRASGGQLPAYGFPEAAVSALARAVRYGAWRAEPSEPVPDFADIRPADARALVYRFLDDAPAGGWLPPGPAAELLRCYGITLTGLTPVASEDEAVAAAAATGGPVVLKADVPGLVHKTDAGAVQLDLRTQADVRDAYRSLQSRFTGRLRRILVQPMIIGGTEVIIGVVDDHMFGPLVVFGLGGVATEVLADHAARLTPLSGTDADQLIGSIRSARLLLGHRGTPAADLGALRELLLRVSRLADDLPEITDLDLNPVIARPDGAFAVDARVKVAPYQPEDPYLRKLR
jgi:acyl-CoA synthetase (NDP forming)/GNAT superfamily N-acetyltransferase